MSNYIPVCLYTNTIYNKKKWLLYILENYIENSQRSLILICDNLHAYNSMLMGKYVDIKKALIKSKSIGNYTLDYMFQVFEKYGDLNKISFQRWQDISNTNNYQTLKNSIEHYINNNNELKQVVNNFVNYHVNKLNWGIYKKSSRWEYLYIIEEITMSIYCTEVLGYYNEIWEKNPELGHEYLDPIGYLYRNFAGNIKSIVGNESLNRKMLILNQKD